MGQSSARLTILNTGAQAQSCCSRDGHSAQEDSLLRELQDIVERSRKEAGTVSSVFAPHGNSDRFEATFRLDEPLALVAERHHQPVDSMHAWVGVKEGALAILDQDDHELFLRLERGETPAALRRALAAANAVSEEDAWANIARVIGRIARGGLLRDLQGHTDRGKIPSPNRFARFHLTKACQLTCAHCYADSSPLVDRHNELSTERWQRLLVDFANNGGEQLLLTGGEALLHPGCLELMQLARKRSMKVTLFTNGLLVPRYVNEINTYADTVQVSLDGPDAATNDLIRGHNTYGHILKAIDLLVSGGTPTRIGMTVVPSMWAVWKERFELFASRYAQYSNVEFRLNYGVMQYGRGTEIGGIDNQDPEDVNRFLARINRRDGAKITRVRTGCGYAEQLVVGPDGTIYPCHLLDGPVCHIDDMPLPEIVELLLGLIRQTDVDHVEGCSTCEIRYLCGGTCRVLGSHATGSRLITDCTPEEKFRKYQRLASTFAT